MAVEKNISLEELDKMEATLQQGLQICYRLKKQLGPAATGSNTRKGLNQGQRVDLTIKRRKHFLRKAS